VEVAQEIMGDFRVEMVGMMVLYVSGEIFQKPGDFYERTSNDRTVLVIPRIVVPCVRRVESMLAMKQHYTNRRGKGRHGREMNEYTLNVCPIIQGNKTDVIDNLIRDNEYGVYFPQRFPFPES